MCALKEWKAEVCLYTMFIAALFTIAKKRNQPTCPFMVEWIRKPYQVCTMEYYYSALKKEGNTAIYDKINELVGH